MFSHVGRFFRCLIFPCPRLVLGGRFENAESRPSSHHRRPAVSRSRGWRLFQRVQCPCGIDTRLQRLGARPAHAGGADRRHDQRDDLRGHVQPRNSPVENRRRRPCVPAGLSPFSNPGVPRKRHFVPRGLGRGGHRDFEKHHHRICHRPSADPKRAAAGTNRQAVPCRSSRSATSCCFRDVSERPPSPIPWP